MKKILLLMALILNIGTSKPSLANLKLFLKKEIKTYKYYLTWDEFFLKGFHRFDNDSFKKYLDEKKIKNNYKWVDNVKVWWNDEDTWFIKLFNKDSIGKRAAISLTKAARAVWFTPKAIISFTDNLRKIFFNNSKTFNDFLHKSENEGLISIFSKMALLESQNEKVLKITEIVTKKKTLTSIGDIKEGFGVWTKWGALSDLEDALFPKEIRAFLSEKNDVATGFLSSLRNVAKKVIGSLDIFNLFYKGNLFVNSKLIEELEDARPKIFNKFNPELKLAFFKQLSTKNQKILLAKISSVDAEEITGDQIRDYLVYLNNVPPIVGDEEQINMDISMLLSLSGHTIDKDGNLISPNGTIVGKYIYGQGLDFFQQQTDPQVDDLE